MEQGPRRALALTPPQLDYFCAIDWSGAKGERQKGIAIALCDARGGPPVLVDRGKAWSRDEVLSILRDGLPDRTLVGMDLGISLPFGDTGSYFPGKPNSPTCAKELWALIDGICSNDPHLEAGGFVDHPEFSPYFRRHGGREGEFFRAENANDGRGRFRVTEQAQAAMGCKPYSNFNLVGAAQVGKSSLTGMRLLHRLSGIVPIWPIDPLPKIGTVICEIYTALAAIEAGRRSGQSKMRSFEDLNKALGALECPSVGDEGAIDDHSSDAILTAAWLRKAALRPDLWQPPALTKHIAKTEGWTFGAV